MKRIVSLFLCMALAVGAVTYKPPQAKAIALEATGAVALIGIFLTSMGLYWAYDNYQSAVADAPVTKFGSNLADDIKDYIYEKTGEYDGNVIKVFFGGNVPELRPGPGNSGVSVVATASVIATIASFGKWLYDKYALAENESAVVSFENGSITLADGSSLYLSSWQETSSISPVFGTVINANDSFTFTTGVVLSFVEDEASRPCLKVFNAEGVVDRSVSPMPSGSYVFLYEYEGEVKAGYKRSDWSFWSSAWGIPANFISVLPGYSLSVSAPNGLNLPDTDALPEGQGYALELPETNGAPIQDLNNLMDLVVPMAVNNPEYVPSLNPTEITNPVPNPNPSPDGEEVPDPAPEGATIIDYLVDLWRKIKALPETIGNAVKSAFEPDPELVTEITTTFTDKFGWLETVHRFGNDLFCMTADTAPPVIYIHLEDAEGEYTYGGTEKALDLSWYQRYKADVDHILSGFMWLAFLWLVFKRASAIIQGGEMITEYTNNLDQGHR